MKEKSKIFFFEHDFEYFHFSIVFCCDELFFLLWARRGNNFIFNFTWNYFYFIWTKLDENNSIFIKFCTLRFRSCCKGFLCNTELIHDFFNILFEIVHERSMIYNLRGEGISEYLSIFRVLQELMVILWYFYHLILRNWNLLYFF